MRRFVRYQHLTPRLCVADPENSVFFEAHRTGRRDLTCARGPGVEGIGRPRGELSFIPSVIDRCIRVPNAASFGAIHFLESVIRRKCGGSTGTNLYAACELIAEMVRDGQSGSVVTILCDTGDRYLNTYYNPVWLKQNGYDLTPHVAKLARFFRDGQWQGAR